MRVLGKAECYRPRMKIQNINAPGAGSWARDCELISCKIEKGLIIHYHKDEDDTFWSISCEGLIAFKFTAEELSTAGYLVNLPTDGAFFEVIDSPWISEFEFNARLIQDCKHYIFEFYDETLEIIAKQVIFNKIESKS